MPAGAGAQGAAVLLPQLFQQAVEQFQRGEFEDSLATFERVDNLSRRPGLEEHRERLATVVPFYRAANLAMLGREAEAVDAFLAFLDLQPNAELEAGAFPEPVEQAFRQAKQSLESGRVTIDVAYERFRKGSSAEPLPVDERWDDSAVRYLMTPEEKSAWASLPGDAERREFVEEFWRRRDPTPETPANELRLEFEARLRFADLQWSDEKVSGRESDRGLVFALLGPPTEANKHDIEGETPTFIRQSPRGGGGGSGGGGGFGAPGAVDRSTGSAGLGQLNIGQEEVWLYRFDEVPEYIEDKVLSFRFVTHPTRGAAILERDAQNEHVLDRVARHANAEGELN